MYLVDHEDSITCNDFLKGSHYMLWNITLYITLYDNMSWNITLLIYDIIVMEYDIFKGISEICPLMKLFIIILGNVTLNIFHKVKKKKKFNADFMIFLVTSGFVLEYGQFNK